MSLSQDDVSASDAAEWLILLSAIGESFTESLEVVEKDFEKHFEKAAEVENEEN